MSGVRHIPPERFTVIGHKRAQAMFAGAFSQDRIHPVWLLGGPRGIGKAQLALQWSLAALGAEPGSSTERVALSGAHPDFLWVGGTEAGDIPVAAIQEVVGFCSRRAAMGGMRAVVIDAVDDMNRFGVNALLKTLEEPPHRSVFFLVYHRQKTLLPALVSRCIKPGMSALSDEEVGEATGRRDPEFLDLVAGRPGLAEDFARPEISECIAATRRILAGSGSRQDADIAMILDAASKYIEVIQTVVQKWCQNKAARAESVEEAGHWARIYELLTDIHHDRRELLLDPSQAAIRMIHAAKSQ